MKNARLNRRQLLTATAGVTVAALAGCLGDDGDDETGTDDGTDTASSSGDDTNGEDEQEAGGEGFVIEGDFELPTDPDPGDFRDMTGTDEVEIETVWRRDNDPEFVFDPPFARVDEGTTVRWRNTDGVFHTVTSTESLENRSQSGTFDETIASDGDTFEWQAESTGTQYYYCTPHAGFMYGAIEVV